MYDSMSRSISGNSDTITKFYLGELASYCTKLADWIDLVSGNVKDDLGMIHLNAKAIVSDAVTNFNLFQSTTAQTLGEIRSWNDYVLDLARDVGTNYGGSVHFATPASLSATKGTTPSFESSTNYIIGRLQNRMKSGTYTSDQLTSLQYSFELVRTLSKLHLHSSHLEPSLDRVNQMVGVVSQAIRRFAAANLHPGVAGPASDHHDEEHDEDHEGHDEEEDGEHKTASFLELSHRRKTKKLSKVMKRKMELVQKFCGVNKGDGCCSLPNIDERLKCCNEKFGTLTGINVKSTENVRLYPDLIINSLSLQGHIRALVSLAEVKSQVLGLVVNIEREIVIAYKNTWRYVHESRVPTGDDSFRFLKKFASDVIYGRLGTLPTDGGRLNIAGTRDKMRATFVAIESVRQGYLQGWATVDSARNPATWATHRENFGEREIACALESNFDFLGVYKPGNVGECNRLPYNSGTDSEIVPGSRYVLKGTGSEADYLMPNAGAHNEDHEEHEDEEDH